MAEAGEGNSTKTDEADIDTIEMELRPDDVARMAKTQGAEDAAAKAPEVQLVGPERPGAPEPAVDPSVAQATPSATLTKRTDAGAKRAGRIEVTTAAPRTDDEEPRFAIRGPRTENTPSGGETQAVVPGAGWQRPPWHWIALSGAIALVAVLFLLANLSSVDATDPLPDNPPAPTEPIEQLVPEPEQEPVPVPVSAPAAEAPRAPPSRGGTVRFRNPFDATEVFEFPPGTSLTEARDAVADVLIQRARERQTGSRETTRQVSDESSEGRTTAAGLADSSARRRR